MEMTAMLLAASLLGGWEPVSEEGEIHEKQETKGDWHLFTVADPFGDPEGWFAAAPTVDGTGEVRFECAVNGFWAGRPRLTVYADDLGRDLPSDFGDWEAMPVQIRVDGGEAVSTIGMRPNEIASMSKVELETYEGEPLNANQAVRLLQGGRKAVLRFEDTVTGIVGKPLSREISLQKTSRKHVFAVSLEGFREASAWVIGKCGWKPL